MDIDSRACRARRCARRRLVTGRRAGASSGPAASDAACHDAHLYGCVGGNGVRACAPAPILAISWVGGPPSESPAASARWRCSPRSITLPRLPATDAPGLGTFALLLRRPRIRVGLITVMFLISGHFAGFTYLRAFLEQITRLDVQTLSLGLLAFGVAGFFGNLAGGFIAERSARLSVALAALLLSATAFVLLAYGASTSAAIAATAGVGLRVRRDPGGNADLEHAGRARPRGKAPVPCW